MRRDIAEQSTAARVLLLAACEESGQAADADENGPSPYALFTEKLLDVWNHDSRITYRELIARIASLVESVCAEQHPVREKWPRSEPSFDHTNAFRV
jgi:hypothetical protein